MRKRLPHPVKVIDTHFGLEMTEDWRSPAVMFSTVGLVACLLAGMILAVMGLYGLGLIMVALSVIGAYPVAAFNLNRTHITVTSTEARVSHGPIPLRRSAVVPAAAVRDVIKTTRANVCDIDLELENGRRVKLLRAISDDIRADFLLRQIKRHLNLIRPLPLPSPVAPGRKASGNQQQTDESNPISAETSIEPMIGPGPLST